MSSGSSILHEAGGGNERVMRLFRSPAFLEEADELELANKVKTIEGKGGKWRDSHIANKSAWKIDCVNIQVIAEVRFTLSLQL